MQIGAQAFLYRLTTDREASAGEARVRFGVRLGEHSWLPIASLLRSGAADSSLVNTALLTVCLPPPFDRDLVQISKASAPRGVTDLVQLIIAALFAAIRTQGGVPPAMRQYHSSDDKWPIGTSSSAQHERAKRLKTSLYRYYIEVLAWQLREARSEAIGTVSYALLRVLEPIQAYIEENEVDVETFNDLALKQLTMECGVYRILCELEADESRTESIASRPRLRFRSAMLSKPRSAVCSVRPILSIAV